MKKGKPDKTKLLLHTCCAPCLTVAEERLRPNFDIMVFWYNPNIEPESEHQERFDTLIKFLEEIDLELTKNYDYMKENKKWHEFIKGLETEPESGKRCQRCIEFRLNETLQTAKRFNINRICTTLSTSPYKNSEMINLLGSKLSSRNKILYLNSNFQSNNGYKRSIELSKKYNLYRQKFCGCQYSAFSTEKN